MKKCSRVTVNWEVSVLKEWFNIWDIDLLFSPWGCRYHSCVFNIKMKLQETGITAVPILTSTSFSSLVIKRINHNFYYHVKKKTNKKKMDERWPFTKLKKIFTPGAFGRVVPIPMGVPCWHSLFEYIYKHSRPSLLRHKQLHQAHLKEVVLARFHQELKQTWQQVNTSHCWDTISSSSSNNLILAPR